MAYLNPEQFRDGLDISRTPSPAPHYDGVLYFGYGSNLWQYQVARRCPNARYVGIARLRHWRWQINQRGYANVVESPKVPYDASLAHWLGPLMPSHDVEQKDLRQDNLRTYGMVYELTPEDEKKMDKFEDVPNSYTKEESFVEFWPRREGDTGKVNLLRRGKRVKVVFYCDRKNMTDSPDNIFRAYSYKMNQGIVDAIEEGIPEGYVNECLRPFVPNVDDSGLHAAIQDAMMMGVDVKKLVEKVESELAVTNIKQETNTIVSKESLQLYFQSIMPESLPQSSNASEASYSSGELNLNLNKDTSRRRALSSRW
jgi:gamma-glutamylcyclotransferase